MGRGKFLGVVVMGRCIYLGGSVGFASVYSGFR